MDGEKSSDERMSRPPEEEYDEPRISLGPLSLLGFGPKSNRRRFDDRPAQGNALHTTAALVIVIAALKVAQPVLLPLIVSAFLAVLIAPLVLYLKKRRVPPAFGVPLVVLSTILLIAGVLGLVIGTLNAFIQQIPTYEARISSMVAMATAQLDNLGLRLTVENVTKMVNPESAISFAGSTLSEIADLLSNTFLVFFMTIFVLFEALVLPEKIRDALRDPTADLSQGIHVVGRIKAYVVIKTSTSLASGVIIGLTLKVMGVDFALLWGLLAFLLNFIPNIGSVIAAVPAALMALLQFGPTGGLATVALFIVVDAVIGNVVESRVMGQRMNLSPLVVFVSLVFWGWLWGILGMLLSVPLTMAIRIMLEGNEQTRPFAVLMAGVEGSAEGRPSLKAPRLP
jgi:AI-2 transport protein TqsA